MSTTFFYDLDNADSPSLNVTATHAGWLVQALGYKVDWDDAMMGEAPAVEMESRLDEFYARYFANDASIQMLREDHYEILSYVVGHVGYLLEVIQAALTAGQPTIYWS